MAFKKSDLVRFELTLEHPVSGRAGARRAGLGVIADDEVNYQCWPPGRTVKVSASDDYKPGERIAVATHNLSKLK